MGIQTCCTGCLNTALCFLWGLSKGLRGVLERDSLLLNYFMPYNAGMKTYWQVSVVIFFQGLQLKKISPRNMFGFHRLEVWVHPSTFRCQETLFPTTTFFSSPGVSFKHGGEINARRRVSVSCHRCHHCPVVGAVAGENQGKCLGSSRSHPLTVVLC